MKIKGTGTIFLCASMKERQQPWGIVLCTVVRPDFSSEKIISTIYSDGMYFFNTAWIMCSGIILLKYIIVVVWHEPTYFLSPELTQLKSYGDHIIWFSFECFSVNESTTQCVAKCWAVRLNTEPMGVTGRGMCSSFQPTQTVIFLPFFPPSQQSLVTIPAPAGQWETMHLYPTCCHSFLSSTQSCFHLSSLVPCHWRLVNGLKRYSIGWCTPSRQGGLTFPGVGQTQFISAPDQLPAKRTSHPISRRLQHKKQEWGLDSVGVGCRGACGQGRPDGF